MRLSATTLLIPLFILFAPVPRARGADDVHEVLHHLYASPHEARGDYDLFLGEIKALLKNNLRSPTAPVIFNRMLSIFEACSDPTALDDLLRDLDQLGSERKLENGLLAFRARLGWRTVLLRKGRYDEAEALHAFAPLAKHVLVLGPLGFDAPSLHDTIFPPERALRALRIEKGYGGRPTAWRPLVREDELDFLDPGDHLYPAAGCCYVLYQFSCPEVSKVVLHFSSGGNAKLWFNGRLVLDQDRRRARLRTVTRLPLTAAKGWNRVLIKMDTKRSRFRLFVTGRDGYPLPGMEEAEGTHLMEQGPVPDPGGEEPYDLGRIDGLAFLEAYAHLHPTDADAAKALVDFRLLRGLQSRAVAAAKAACAAAPDDAHARYLLGIVFRRVNYLPDNYKINHAREALEKAVELDPGFLPARRELAKIDHENDRSEEAVEKLRGILRENPRFVAIHLDLARVFDDRGWEKERFDAIQAARRCAPGHPTPEKMLGDYYAELDRKDLAFEHYAKALEYDRSRTDLMARVARHRWMQGDLAETLSLYETIYRLERTDEARMRLADVHRVLGDPVKAREILEAVAEDHPGNPAYDMRIGNLALLTRGWEEAEPWYRKALKKVPGLHQAREMLETFGVYSDPLFEEYAAKDEDYTRDLPGKETYPKASALYALDQMITRIYPDGASKSVIHQVVKILDRDGVEAFGRMNVPGRVETLKVIRPDGTVFEPVKAEKENTYNLPGLEEGALVVLRHTLFTDPVPGRPYRLGRFYFQDVDGAKPYLFSRSVTAVPEGFPVAIRRVKPEAWKEETFKREGNQVFVFTARNMPVAEKEELMPPKEAAFPNVEIFQRGTWPALIARMAGTFLPALIPSDELRRKAEEIVEGATDDLEKARRIYAFVNEHVKDDRGGPDATRVLLEGQGSRTALFLALLDAAGVPWDYLRCGMNEGYLALPPDWSDVTEGLFPGELVRIRPRGGNPVLLSMANRLLAFGEIPPPFFGGTAMAVTGRPERIEVLPGGNPTAWLNESTALELRLEGTDAKVKGSFTLPGYTRARFREAVQRLDEGNRKNLFQYNLLRRIYPAARLTSLEIRGIDKGEAEPPTFAFELEAKNCVQPVAGRPGMALLPVPLRLTQAFIRKGTRTFPMVYRGYGTLRYVVDIDLGGKYVVEELPESLVDRRFFVSYALVVKPTDRGVRVERTVTFLPADVPPDRYPELTEMFGAIDEREMEPIILRPAAAPKPAGEKPGTKEVEEKKAAPEPAGKGIRPAP